MYRGWHLTKDLKTLSSDVCLRAKGWSFRKAASLIVPPTVHDAGHGLVSNDSNVNIYSRACNQRLEVVNTWKQVYGLYTDTWCSPWVWVITNTCIVVWPLLGAYVVTWMCAFLPTSVQRSHRLTFHRLYTTASTLPPVMSGALGYWCTKYGAWVTPRSNTSPLKMWVQWPRQPSSCVVLYAIRGGRILHDNVTLYVF